jgi:hypothetical protein
MMTKMTQRTELGPLVGLPTARHARVERGNRSALGSARSCAWIAVVQAHHAAFRSSSHSSMKAENCFQLRVVGVTAIKEPSFGRASSIAIGAAQSRRLDSCSLRESRGGSIVRSTGF